MTERRKNPRLDHALARIREIAPRYDFVERGNDAPVLIKIKRPPKPTKEKQHA